MFVFKNSFPPLDKTEKRMWAFGAPMLSNVVSFFSSSTSYETWSQNPVDRLKGLYQEIDTIVNNMRDRGEVTNQDWVDSSKIIPKLNTIIDLIVEEEREYEKNAKEDGSAENTLLCRKFILDNQKIHDICSYAMADNPKGLAAIITQHLTKLFREVSYPFFSTDNIHVSISVLIQKLKYFVVDSSLGQTIIDFIEIICEKLCDNSELIEPFFLQHSPKSPSPESVEVSFSLIEPLLPFMNEISCRRQVRRILLMLAAFPYSDITVYLSTRAPIVSSIIQHLLEAIQQLHTNNYADEELLEPPLTYLSELLRTCKNTQEYKDNPLLGLAFYNALVNEFKEKVLKGFFEVELLTIRNSRIQSSTRLLTVIISSRPSPPIIDCIAQFLFTSESLLVSSLISRMNSHNSTLSILTLQLFNALLRTQHPLVIASLLTNNLSGFSESDALDNAGSFNAFESSFKESLPTKELINGRPSEKMKNMMNDVEYEVISIAMTKVQEADTSSEGIATCFVKNLLSRLSKFLRQPINVNLAVSQVVTTLSMIMSPSLFDRLFTNKHPVSIAHVLNQIWEKAVKKSREVNGFEKYVKATETGLSMCDKSAGALREDCLSTDVLFSQFLDGYIVLREFLIELSYSIKLRGTPL